MWFVVKKCGTMLNAYLKLSLRSPVFLKREGGFGGGRGEFWDAIFDQSFSLREYRKRMSSPLI